MAYSLANVFKGTAIFTAGRILTKATSFLLIPIYTRFLTPTDYGIVGYVQTVTQFLAVLLMFGFHGAQKRYFFENHGKNDLGSFLFSINLYLLGVLLIVCVSVTLFGQHIYHMALMNPSVPFSPYFKIFVWAIALQVMNQVAIDFYLARKEHKRCALLQIANFFLINAGTLYYVVGLRQGALGQIKGILFGQLLFFICFYPQYAKHFRFCFSPSQLRYALAFGVPIVVHLLAGILHTSIDRVILERFVSIEKLGIYTLGYQIGAVMSVIVTSASQSWMPHYYELMNQKHLDQKYEVRRVFYMWLIGICCISLIGCLWAKELIVVLMPPRFHGAAAIVPIIAFSYVFEGIYYFVSKPIFFYKKTKMLPFTTGSSAAINIALNLLFIPKWGIMGAAYATGVSSVYMAVVVYLVGKRLFNPSYDLARIGLILLLFLGCGVLLRFDSISLSVEVTKLAIFLGFLGLSYFCFRDYLKGNSRAIA